MLYKLHIQFSSETLEFDWYKFIYVSLCWRNIVLIMSDKFTHPLNYSMTPESL